MATTVHGQARDVVADREALVIEAPRMRPVKLWATFGVVFLAFQGYLFSAWVISGDAKRTPDGPTPIPTYMKVAAHVADIALPIACVAIFYFCLIRPWRREGHVTWDGLFVLALPTLLWQDVLINYITPWLTYNTALFNLGSWGPHIPGWTSPRGEYVAESLLSLGSAAYVWFLSVPVFVVNAWMRRAKERNPRLSTSRMVLYLVLGFFLFDAVAEPLFMSLGYYSYAGSIQSWWVTLFPGRYYQMPLYSEAIGVGCMLAAFACFRYFRNDKGESIAERGSGDLVVSPRARTVVRYLAMVGVLNLITLTFFSWMAFWGLHSDEWPADVRNRSYLTDQLCGPGTTYACPGPSIPINRPHSMHVSPDGTLEPPED